MREVWRDVPELPGYQVSSEGNVKSLAKVWYAGRDGTSRREKPDTILSADCSAKYRRVSLFIDGKRVRQGIARMVAMAFIPNPDNKPYVDHIDGDTSNDSVENLRWATNEENQINTGLIETNTSGYTGVFWDTRKSRWRARPFLGGKRVSMGTYASKEEAAAVVAQHRIAQYGEFVRLDAVLPAGS